MNKSLLISFLIVVVPLIAQAMEGDKQLQLVQEKNNNAGIQVLVRKQIPTLSKSVVVKKTEYTDELYVDGAAVNEDLSKVGQWMETAEKEDNYSSLKAEYMFLLASKYFKANNPPGSLIYQEEFVLDLLKLITAGVIGLRWGEEPQLEIKGRFKGSEPVKGSYLFETKNLRALQGIISKCHDLKIWAFFKGLPYSIPSAIKIFGGVKEFNIVSSPRATISTISSELFRLPALTNLSLICCNKVLNEKKDDFKLCTNLTALSVDDNSDVQWGGLVKAIATLTKLQELSLCSNQLNDDIAWGSIRQLTNLGKLWLSSNSLTSIPKWITKLSRLQTLDCSRQEKLRGLPTQLSGFSSLTELYASGNQLGTVFDQSSCLQNIIKLDLSSNEVLTVSPLVSVLTRLETLILLDNCVKEFPEEIGFLHRLKCLDIRHNPVEILPTSMTNLSALKDIKFGGVRLSSGISAILFCLTFLENLTFSNAGLKEIPQEIRYLTNLKSLDFSFNKLTDIGLELNYLKRLKSLELNNNQLTEKVFSNISSLTRLEKLGLSSNSIASIPADITSFKQLSNFSLSYNSSIKVPEGMRSMTQLKELFLNDMGHSYSVEEWYKKDPTLFQCGT